MATIVNDRDVFLQSAATRFAPPTIPQDRVEGLPGRLDNIEGDINGLQDAVGHLMNTSGNFAIRASSMTFIGGSSGTSPSTITLTVVKGSGLTGTVTWAVFAGSASISPSSGDSTTVTGSSVSGNSVTIRARIISDGVIHDAFVTLNRLGAIAAEDKVDLDSQVTGSLAAGNVSGLGALALLNTVDLNSQTTGTLNGQTQVTNLGSLAYANSIAADQIGAGTLAAGVVYAGEINADNITSGTITGRTFQTAETGRRVEISHLNNALRIYDSNNFAMVKMEPGTRRSTFESNVSNESVLAIRNFNPSNGWALTVDGKVGLMADGTSGKVPVRLVESPSLPADRSAGNICYYGGWLCFANGSHWFQSDGTRLT